MGSLAPRRTTAQPPADVAAGDGSTAQPTEATRGPVHGTTTGSTRDQATASKPPRTGERTRTSTRGFDAADAHRRIGPVGYSEIGISTILA